MYYEYRNRDQNQNQNQNIFISHKPTWALMKRQKLGARFQLVVSYGEEPARNSTVTLFKK